MSLSDIRMEHIRGALLGLLRDGTWFNDAVLHDAVNNVKYVSAARDQVREALRWLHGQGLIAVEEIATPGGGQPVMRGRIAARGLDFEEGRIFVEGIRRPSGT